MAKGRFKKEIRWTNNWKIKDQINIISTVITGINFQTREKDFRGQIVEMFVQLGWASFFIGDPRLLIYDYKLWIPGREDFICSTSHVFFFSSHRAYFKNVK